MSNGVFSSFEGYASILIRANPEEEDSIRAALAELRDIDWANPIVVQERIMRFRSMVQHVRQHQNMQQIASQKHLNLAGQQLRVPPDLLWYIRLEELNLNDNQLVTPPVVSRRPTLQRLYIMNNCLGASPNVDQNPNLEELILSNNVITVAPNVRQNPHLVCLALGSNQLRDAPNVDQNPNLEELILCQNLITVAPNVRQNPNLVELNLSENYLIVPPDISQNRNLMHLRLRDNHLGIAPDVSQNPNLIVLDLRNNQIKHGISVDQNAKLKILNLGDNPLVSLPDVSQNPDLERFILAYCQLTVAPDVRQNPNLVELDLSNNDLTCAPDVSQNHNLEAVDISYNNLTSLPDSILYLPRGCVVDAQENLFPPGYAAYFQQCLEKVRAEDPTRGPTVHMSSAWHRVPEIPKLSLNQRLREWSDAFESEVAQEDWGSRPQMTEAAFEQTFQALLALEQDDQEEIEKFLGKLTLTGDYLFFNLGGHQAKKMLLKRVDRILRFACENEEFRAKMLMYVRDGATDCSDRTILIFNDLDIHWQMAHVQNEESLQQLCIQTERYNQVRKYAIADARQRGLGDEVEVVLYYLTRLKDRGVQLAPPFDTSFMLYPGVAQVDEAMEGDAHAMISQLTDEELLSRSDHWTDHLLKKYNEQIQGHLETIDIACGDFMELAAEYYDLPAEERAQFLADRPQLPFGTIANYGSACDFMMKRKPSLIAAFARKVDRANRTYNPERAARQIETYVQVIVQMLKGTPASRSE